MIRRADVFTVDRQEVEDVWKAWEKIEPFIPAGCDPENTRVVRDGLLMLLIEARGEEPRP